MLSTAMRLMFALLKSWWPLVLATAMMILWIAQGGLLSDLSQEHWRGRLEAELQLMAFEADDIAQSYSTAESGSENRHIREGALIEVKRLDESALSKALSQDIDPDKRQHFKDIVSNHHQLSGFIASVSGAKYLNIRMVNGLDEVPSYLWVELDVSRRLASLFRQIDMQLSIRPYGDSSTAKPASWQPKLGLFDILLPYEQIDVEQLGEDGFPYAATHGLWHVTEVQHAALNDALLIRLETHQLKKAHQLGRIQLIGMLLTAFWLLASLMMRVWPILRQSEATHSVEQLPQKDIVKPASADTSPIHENVVPEQIPEYVNPMPVASPTEADNAEQLNVVDPASIPEAFPRHMTQDFSKVDISKIRQRDEDKPYWQLFDEFISMRSACSQDNHGITYPKFERKLLASKAQIMRELKVEDVEYHVHQKNGRAALKAVPIVHS